MHTRRRTPRLDPKVTVVDRKLCASCGNPNLETETRCWACGSTRFAPLGAKITGDPTMDLGEGVEPTLSWMRGRAVSPGWFYAAGAFAFALFMCVVGFWIGRASATEEVPAPEVQAPQQPIVLPAPPTSLSVPSAQFGYSDARANTGHPDPVTIRTRPPQVAQARPPARPTQFPGAAPGSTSPGNVPANTPGQGPQVPVAAAQPAVPEPRVIYRSGLVTQPWAPVTPPTPPAATPTLPAPSGTTAVIALRNEAPFPVEFTVEGGVTRSALVSAGSTIPLTLPAGSYEIRARGGGASSSRSTLSLGANRSYSLAVGRKDEDGLAIRESSTEGAR
jgi:hypothetical protein